MQALATLGRTSFIQAVTSNAPTSVGPVTGEAKIRATSFTRSRQLRQLRIVISVERRTLWVVRNQDTLLTAPAAIATGDTLVYLGHSWIFNAPWGQRTVVDKKIQPVWTAPDWHYAEVAKAHGFGLRTLTERTVVRLRDGLRLAARGRRVGILEVDGRFTPLPLSEEIVFDSILYIPPVSSVHREMDGVLGHFSLEIGDGFLLHGTPDQSAIGRAVTHGCFRLRDADIAWLYRRIPLGTPVFVY